MAVTKSTYNSCKSYFQDHLKIAELGAQYVMGEDWGGYGPPYFKNMFSSLDITTFDINGENRSIALNLSNPIDNKYKNVYDLVTNFGTTEHVQNQYTCWKNIFEMLKIGGLVLSEIPKKGSWPGHCKYYFDESTFESMKEDFEIVEIRDHHFPVEGNLIFCVMRKKHSGKFITSQESLYDKLQVVETYVDHQGH